MKKILFLIAIFPVLTVNAQDYYISFAGTGASNAVDSVKVENLMSGSSLTLKGDDILHLTGTVGVPSYEFDKTGGLRIYPNPMTDFSTVEISPSIEGEAVLSVFDMTGKQLYQTQYFLEKSRQEFRLSCPKDGFYLISVRGINYRYSGKLLCKGHIGGIFNVEKVSDNVKTIKEKTTETEKKGSKGSTVGMGIAVGDRLKYTGYSGTYGTVTTEVPTQDKTVTFNFIPCSIGLVNYFTVKIGDLIWMASDLRTNQYTDGSPITVGPFVPDGTPAYCYYNNSGISDFGALYNWDAVNTGNLCPTGWRVASDFDWVCLAVYLGGENITGGKLKETETRHWMNPNYGATNEVGFTALPGGAFMEGSFRNHDRAGYWWTQTEVPGGSYAYYRSIFNESGGLSKFGYMLKMFFFSVRCVKD